MLTTLFLVWIIFLSPDLSDNEVGLYFVYILSAFPAVGILGAFYSDWVLWLLRGICQVLPVLIIVLCIGLILLRSVCLSFLLKVKWCIVLRFKITLTTT